MDQAIENQSSTPLAWVGLALIAHSGWGIQPVLARYLQTVSGLPGLSLLAVMSFIGIALSAGYFFPRMDWSALRKPIVWAFMAAVMTRGVCNILAARYTLSIYVQLMNQMAPFLIVLLSLSLFKQRIPRNTLPAICLCLLGAVLMMSGDLVGAGNAPADAATRNDLLGISLAVVSALSLAFYMLIIRRSADAVDSNVIYVAQGLCIIAVGTVFSLIAREDWTAWTRLDLNGYIAAAAYILVVMLGANLGQILAIRQLGAPIVSSMLAWRLVAALLLGGALLGERLTSVWQVIGAALVLVTITWYLRGQSVSQASQAAS